MSTMRANTLANAAGTQSPDVVGGEFCRARFNLNGTGTIAARDTFNISSFVDNGVGDYTANFSISFPNIDYSGLVMASYASVSAGSSFTGVFKPPFSMSSARTLVINGASGSDMDTICCAFFGDKP